MFIAVQLVIVAVGLFIMTRGRFSIGGREVGNPIASIGRHRAGDPVAARVDRSSIGLQLADGPPATTAMRLPTRAGQPVQIVHVPVAGAGDNYWWVDPLVTCAAVLIAAGLTGIALRAANDTEDVYASLSAAKSDTAP